MKWEEIKVLIVDDMQQIRVLVKDQLRSIGIKVFVEADSGDKALDILNKMPTDSNSAEHINFVVADWNMPNTNGLQLLKKMRENNQWAQIPFIMLTSESDREAVTKALFAGASQYMVKPFNRKIFEEKIKSAWTKHHKED